MAPAPCLPRNPSSPARKRLRQIREVEARSFERRKGGKRVEKVYGWIDFFNGTQDYPTYVFWKYPTKNADDSPKYGTMGITIASNLYYPNNYYKCDEFIEISGSKGIMWINQCTCGGNFVSKSPQYPPIVVYINGEVKTYGSPRQTKRDN